MHETAINVKERVKNQIETEALLTGDYFSVTFDMWSDAYRQRPFISITLHYIDDNFKIQHPLICVKQFIIDDDVGAKKSTQNIRIFLKKSLSEYFLADRLENIFSNMSSVTDGGSNCVAVFPQRYSCKCHDLNLVLEWTFEKEDEKQNAMMKLEAKKADLQSKIKELENLPAKNKEREKLEHQFEDLVIPKKKEFILSNSCPIIKSSLVSVKQLVTYFKQTGLNKHLKQSLKQDVTTRWNSHLIMLESYQKSREEVQQILCKNNQLNKIQNIDDNLVDQLVEVLKIFRECTESLSSDKHPTIHLVAQWRNILYTQMRANDDDLQEIKNVKIQLVICLDEYFQLKDLHLGAAMLDPR